MQISGWHFIKNKWICSFKEEIYDKSTLDTLYEYFVNCELHNGLISSDDINDEFFDKFFKIHHCNVRSSRASNEFPMHFLENKYFKHCVEANNGGFYDSLIAQFLCIKDIDANNILLHANMTPSTFWNKFVSNGKMMKMFGIENIAGSLFMPRYWPKMDKMFSFMKNENATFFHLNKIKYFLKSIF